MQKEVVKLYVLTDIGNIQKQGEKRIRIEEYTFNYNNPDDRETVEDYTEDESEELTIDNFYEACRVYVIENEIMVYEQNWCRCMLLNEKMMEELKWVIENGIEKIS